MSWSVVDDTLRRLRALLSDRVGPVGAREVLAHLTTMRAAGARPADVLAAARQIEQAFSAREPLAAPFSSAVCRALASSTALKLAHLSSRVSFATPARGLTDVEIDAIAAHADALLPSFGDVDVCLGVAWKSALLYRSPLLLGECWNRNDGTPLWELAAAAAGLGLDDDAVAVGVLRDRGVVVARGDTVPREDAPWTPRSFSFVRFGGGSIDLGVVGSGDVDGVRVFLAELSWPLTPATVPWLVHLVLIPFAWDAVVADPDGVVAAFVAGEDALEQERLHGEHAGVAAARLGRPGPRAAARDRLRLRVDDVDVVVYAGGDLMLR